MQNNKFTQGPWSVNQVSWLKDHVEINSKNWGALALVVSKCGVVSGISIDDKSDECKANATLISVAPEMYEMLDKISDGLLEAGGFGNCRLAKEIEVLLAKARGES